MFPTRRSPISIDNNGSFRFKREEHLKGRKDIQEVFNKGKRYGCQGAKLYALRNELTYNRICFTFARLAKKKQSAGLRGLKGNQKIDNKVSWNAVARNRARRLSREAFRLMKNRFANGYDFILLIYPDTECEMPRKSLSDRIAQLESLFTRAGLYK